MPTNHAAYINEKQAPLTVSEAPYTEPKENEILIKTTAVAINPVDWKIQSYGIFLQNYPNILGEDVAGTVEAVGSNITDVKKGDRVFGHCASLGNGNQSEAAFQEYVIMPKPLFMKTPDDVEDNDAVVIPLGIDTACAGLFQDDALGLKMPPSSEGNGKAVLIWGGSSSVGANAIQLAAAAGYEVFTTASKHNHGFCKDLGAAQVFDYNDSDIVGHMVEALKGKEFVGAMDTISEADTVKTTIEIITKAGGVKKLATTLPGSDEHASSGVKITPVFALTVAGNEVGPHIWSTFLPKSLADGSFKARPHPIIAGTGLDSIQKGMDMNKKGVSGKKVIVSLI